MAAPAALPFPPPPSFAQVVADARSAAAKVDWTVRAMWAGDVGLGCGCAAGGGGWPPGEHSTPGEHPTPAPPDRRADTRHPTPTHHHQEPWIQGLLAAHALLLVAVLTTRSRPAAQGACFFLAAAGVRCGEAANAVLAAHWRSLGFRRPYFDGRGVFYSCMVSAPLLIVMAVQTVGGRLAGGARASRGARARPAAALRPARPPSPPTRTPQTLFVAECWGLAVRAKRAQLAAGAHARGAGGKAVRAGGGPKEE